MILITYWVIKFLVWAGIVFSLYSVVQPELMLQFFVKSLMWKMKWLGLKGMVEPAKDARNITRIWSVVMALIFFAISYIFGKVFFLGYVLKS